MTNREDESKMELLTTIKEFARWHHLNEMTIAAGKTPSDSEIEFEAIAWNRITRALSTPSVADPAEAVQPVGGAGWHSHAGTGDPDIPGDTLVQVCFRDGDTGVGVMHDWDQNWSWLDTENGLTSRGAIIAWRLHPALSLPQAVGETPAPQADAVAWLLQGDGWGEEVMFSEKEARERAERLGRTWAVSVSPLYASPQPNTPPLSPTQEGDKGGGE